MNAELEQNLPLEKSKRTITVPFIVMLIGVLMLIATFFMPFASANNEYRDYLQKNSDKMYAEEINMTNGEAKDISFFEFDKMYAKAANAGMSKSTAITCVVIISGFALFVVMATLFVLLKKPIVTLIFNLLSLGMFLLVKWDFKDRGVLPNSRYDYGAAEYICYIGFVVVVIGAVLFIIAKKRNKQIK